MQMIPYHKSQSNLKMRYVVDRIWSVLAVLAHSEAPSQRGRTPPVTIAT